MLDRVAIIATGALRNVLNITPKVVTKHHLQPDTDVPLDEVHPERRALIQDVEIGLEPFPRYWPGSVH